MSNYTEAQLRQMDDKELMRIYYSTTSEIERSPLLDTLFQRLEERAKEVKEKAKEIAFLEGEIDDLLDRASGYRAEIEELEEEIEELQEKLEAA